MLTAALALPLVLVFADDGQINILIDPAAGYTITKSGSYVLVADVTMTADVSAIVIMAGLDDVTIDLNGHTLIGTGSGLGASGIFAGDSSRLRIFNGRIQGFGRDGVSVGHETHIHDVTVADNGQYGISAIRSSLIERCTAIGNNKDGGFAGIRVFGGSTVRDCTSVANNPTSTGSTAGILAMGGGHTIARNRCSDNTSPDDEAVGISARAEDANSTMPFSP